ncbi:hypothetical protein BGZ58_001616 [Dissophora ornata]|nr:hypothetical protein BGZ58_001616 [Dissophora ornata]
MIYCDGICMKPDSEVDEGIVDYTANSARILDSFESVVFHKTVQGGKDNPNAGYIEQVGLVSAKVQKGEVDMGDVEDEEDVKEEQLLRRPQPWMPSTPPSNTNAMNWEISQASDSTAPPSSRSGDGNDSRMAILMLMMAKDQQLR